MVKKVVIDSKILSGIILEGLREKKATDLVRINLKKVDGAITDYFIICTATSDRHAQALADSVGDMTKLKAAEKPLNVEGYTAGEWILLDYVDVIVHIFLRDKREFYNIEELWGDGKMERWEG